MQNRFPYPQLTQKQVLINREIKENLTKKGSLRKNATMSIYSFWLKETCPAFTRKSAMAEKNKDAIVYSSSPAN
jgi:hypothetical protein